MDNYVDFVKDESEWRDTGIALEFARQGGQTKDRFTRVDLVPAHECHGDYSGDCGTYVNGSLANLITTGMSQLYP